MANADALKFLELDRLDLDEALPTIELSGFRLSTSGSLLQQASDAARPPVRQVPAPRSRRPTPGQGWWARCFVLSPRE
jgi:hypothetical protein